MVIATLINLSCTLCKKLAWDKKVKKEDKVRILEMGKTPEEEDKAQEMKEETLEMDKTLEEEDRAQEIKEETREIVQEEEIFRTKKEKVKETLKEKEKETLKEKANGFQKKIFKLAQMVNMEIVNFSLNKTILTVKILAQNSVQHLLKTNFSKCNQK